nr:hypothetical protein [Armatimonas sp.]
MNNDNDDDLGQMLRAASVPDPIGGHEPARERLMGRVRHQFPVETRVRMHSPRLYRSLTAGAVLAGLTLVVFLAWPEQKAEALPSEAQMQRFYDQHETHHTAHFQESETQR